MIKSFKYRLYPTKEQKVLLNKHFGGCRFIYNLALETKKTAWESHRVNLSAYNLIRQITGLKNEEQWLKEVSNTSLQQSIISLESAYKGFFKTKSGFPKFKNRYSKQSFSNLENLHVDFEKGEIRFPKFQKKNGIKCVFDRGFEGDVKKMTISKTRTGKYYVSILVNTSDIPAQKNNPDEQTAVGIDLGLSNFAITSDGEIIENPKYLRTGIQRIKVLQKRVSRKQEGSANRAKANLRVARQQEKIAFQRNDFLHKLSKRLITENQGGTICLETLNVSGMIKNHKLAQSIQDASWAEFVRQLKYKGDWYGVNILQIGRFEPSSKTCTCGHVNKELTLSDREWTCQVCGITHDRDLLAANNIKKFAFDNLRNSGAGCSVEPVEMSPVGESMKQEASLLIVN